MKSSTGHVWTKVGEDSYRDEATGLTWSQEFPKKMTWDEAQLAPTNLYQILYLDDILDPTLKWHLPTKEDFELAEKHGIRSILDMRTKWFWASTIVSSIRDYAWYFDSGGLVFVSPRSNAFNVRCVGR